MRTRHCWIAALEQVWLALVMGLGLSLAAYSARAADSARLRVNVFPGSWNLALFAGLARGFFKKRHLKVELQFTRFA